jgi:hypothetical protein
MKMKYSSVSFEKLIGVRQRVRHKMGLAAESFADPIIHREIQGDRVFVPLNLERVWNEV